MARHASPVAPRANRPVLRLDALESREVPSIGVEDVASLPHLAGMSSDYPADGWARYATAPAPTPTVAPILKTTRGRFAIASGPGQVTAVNVYDGKTNALLGIINPYGRTSTVGARVAVADVTGDGIEDIVVAPGAGAAPVVKVFDGKTLTEVRSFLAYGAAFTGGVFVAAGDVNGDGRGDIVTGAGASGGPHVKMFSGKDLFPGGAVKLAVEPPARQSYFATESDFRGGVSVAIADVNGDGFADIVAGAGPGGGPRVVVVSGRDGARLQDYFAYDPSLRTGVMVAAGQFDGSGKAGVVTVPMAGGGPEVKVFRGETLTQTYRPFGADGAGNGVAVRDITGDGVNDILVTSGPGARPRVVVLNAATGKKLRDFPGLTPDYVGGLFVA